VTGAHVRLACPPPAARGGVGRGVIHDCWSWEDRPRRWPSALAPAEVNNRSQLPRRGGVGAEVAVGGTKGKLVWTGAKGVLMLHCE